MEREEKQMEKIEKILLSHRGEKNAITARKISTIVEIEDNDTFINTRMLIRKVIKKKQLPIGALDNGGYFLMEDPKELSEYIQTLNRRIIGITDRKARVIRYFEAYHNKKFDEDGEEEIDCGNAQLPMLYLRKQYGK